MSSKIKKVWFDHNHHLAKATSALPKQEIENQIASIFCPGEFYYYILDFSTLELLLVSDSYQNIIGLDPNTLTIDDLLSRIHPDDIDYFSRCEKVIAKFLFEYLDPPQILNYKISYSFRNLRADGTYSLFLHQVVSLSIDEEGKLEKVMGVHSDISHITTVNNKKLSLLGLNGKPSYTNIDVYQDTPDLFSANKPKLSSRELEIIKLLAEGTTASEIAKALFISEGTVRKHRENILKKTASKNTTHLISKCIREGII